MSPRRFVLPVLWLLLASAAGLPAEVPQRPPSTLRTELVDGKLIVPLALSYHQIVLEEQTAGGGWRPLAVQYPRSLTREQKRSIAFDFPQGLAPEQLRVTGYRTPKFPARITYARKEFERLETLPQDASRPKRLDRLQPARVEAPTRAEKEAAMDNAAREFWHQRDHRLVYISPDRGLQVWDLSNPANPLRLSSLRLPLTVKSLVALPGPETPLIIVGPKNDGQGSCLLVLEWQQEALSIVSQTDLPGQMTDALLSGARMDIITHRTLKGKGRQSLLLQVDLKEPQIPKLGKTTVFSGARPTFRLRNGRLMLQVREGGRRLLHELPLPDAAQSLAARLQAPFPETFLLPGYEITPRDNLLTIRDLQNPDTTPLQVRLSWQVDRVLPLGGYLLQVQEGTASSGTENRPFLRLTPAHDPDHLLKEQELDPGLVAGLTLRGDLLMVAQWLSLTASRPATLRTWVLDVTEPTEWAVLETLDHELPGLGATWADLESLQPHWLNANTLVWSLIAKPDARPWWTTLAVHEGSSVPLMVTPAATLAVLCPLGISQGKVSARPPLPLASRPGVLTHVSAVHTATGLLYLSHDVISPSLDAEPAANLATQVPLRPQPGRVTSWLQVVDFRQSSPVLRASVSIPGQLLGLVDADAQGAVLLTQTDHALRDDAAPLRVVQASAYDGVHASQLTEYFTATAANSAFKVVGGRLFLARHTAPAGVVSLGYDLLTGRLSQQSTWSLPMPPLLLHSTGDHLLASGPGMLEVATMKSESGNLTAQASYNTPDGLWLRVDRASATASQDLWMPAGRYGVEFLQKQANTAP